MRRVALLATMPIAGCSTLPAFGPSSDAITDAAVSTSGDVENILPFELVNVSAEILPDLHVHRTGYPANLRGQRFLVRDKKVRVSDALEITIWEVADDGLFASPGQRRTLIDVVVSNSGEIQVPYVGLVKVAGLTPTELRSLLQERYRGQAIEPEISVRVAATQSRAVSVLGDVNAPQIVEIPSQGVRLLSLLAQTGGTRNPDWEVDVTVMRNGISNTANLHDILSNTSNNVVLLPGDTVKVTHMPRSFPVFGAVSKGGAITLGIPEPSLADLLAEAGGLNNLQAEAASVFVFRQPHSHPSVHRIPVAYRLDFSKPDAFLLASRFEIMPTDIVYVATADASEFQKFVNTLVSPFFRTAVGVQNVGN